MTNRTTEASAKTSAGKPWERAPRHHEKTPRGSQQASPTVKSRPLGSYDADPAIASGPNRLAIRPAAPAERAGGGPRAARATQVVEGEHRKESAKRN